MICFAPMVLFLVSANSSHRIQQSQTRLVLPDATQLNGYKPQGGLIPITLEVEKGVTKSTTAIGTNLYPRNLGGTDPILSVPLFANDDLVNVLGFTNPAL